MIILTFRQLWQLGCFDKTASHCGTAPASSGCIKPVETDDQLAVMPAHAWQCASARAHHPHKLVFPGCRRSGKSVSTSIIISPSMPCERRRRPTAKNTGSPGEGEPVLGSCLTGWLGGTWRRRFIAARSRPTKLAFPPGLPLHAVKYAWHSQPGRLFRSLVPYLLWRPAVPGEFCQPPPRDCPTCTWFGSSTSERAMYSISSFTVTPFKRRTTTR